MATKFTVKIGGEKRVLYGEVIRPEVTEAFWSKDKEGNTRFPSKDFDKMHLGETAFFHFKLLNYPSDEIEMQLFDFDYDTSVSTGLFISNNPFVRDMMDRDDEKFPKKPITKKVKLDLGKDGSAKGVIELSLDKNWEAMLHNDSQEPPRYTSNAIELYWKDTSFKMVLPNDIKDYLTVTYSKRDLYFSPAFEGHNLPELRRGDNGAPIVLLQTAAKVAGSAVFDQGKMAKEAVKVGVDAIDEEISTYVLGELESGKLADNFGKVYQNTKSKTYKVNAFTNEGELINDVTRRKDFTYISPDGKHSTKAIDQYKFFAENGNTRIKLLGVLKTTLNNLDALNSIAGFLTGQIKDHDADPFAKPLDISFLSGLGGFFANPAFAALSLGVTVAGVLIEEVKKEWDVSMDESIRNKELKEAKENGIESLSKTDPRVLKGRYRGGIVQFARDFTDLGYRYIEVNSDVISDILNNRFETFAQLEEKNLTLTSYGRSAIILYRLFTVGNREIKTIQCISYDV